MDGEVAEGNDARIMPAFFLIPIDDRHMIGENLAKTVSDALEARELIKLTVLENCAETPREAAEAIAEATGAQVVGVIGRKVILYRESVNHKTIEL